MKSQSQSIHSEQSTFTMGGKFPGPMKANLKRHTPAHAYTHTYRKKTHWKVIFAAFFPLPSISIRKRPEDSFKMDFSFKLKIAEMVCFLILLRVLMRTWKSRIEIQNMQITILRQVFLLNCFFGPLDAVDAKVLSSLTEKHKFMPECW